MLLPRRVSVLDPLFLTAAEETEDMHLEEEYSNMGVVEECSKDSFFWCCFASETRRFRMARFASLRARSMSAATERKREKTEGTVFCVEIVRFRSCEVFLFFSL